MMALFIVVTSIIYGGMSGGGANCFRNSLTFPWRVSWRKFKISGDIANVVESRSVYPMRPSMICPSDHVLTKPPRKGYYTCHNGSYRIIS